MPMTALLNISTFAPMISSKAAATSRETLSALKLNYVDTTQPIFDSPAFKEDDAIKNILAGASVNAPTLMNLDYVIAIIYGLFNEESTRNNLLKLFIGADTTLASDLSGHGGSDEIFARTSLKHIKTFLAKSQGINEMGDDTKTKLNDEHISFSSGLFDFLSKQGNYKTVEGVAMSAETGYLTLQTNVKAFVQSMSNRLAEQIWTYSDTTKTQDINTALKLVIAKAFEQNEYGLIESVAEGLSNSQNLVTLRSITEDIFKHLNVKKTSRAKQKTGKLPYYLDAFSKDVFSGVIVSPEAKLVTSIFSMEGFEVIQGTGESSNNNRNQLQLKDSNTFSFATEKNTSDDVINRVWDGVTPSLTIKLNAIDTSDTSVPDSELAGLLNTTTGNDYIQYSLLGTNDVRVKVLIRQLLINGIKMEVVFIFGVDFTSIFLGDGTVISFQKDQHMSYKPGSAYGYQKLKLPKFILGALIDEDASNKEYIYESNSIFEQERASGTAFDFLSDFTSFSWDATGNQPNIAGTTSFSGKGTILNFSTNSLHFPNEANKASVDVKLICFDKYDYVVGTGDAMTHEPEFQRIFAAKNANTTDYVSLISVHFSKKNGLVSRIKVGTTEHIIRTNQPA